jgi:hypothetical protein
MPYVSKIRSTSSAVVMVLLATLLCVATKAQAQKLPPLETHLNPSETAFTLVDFQYPFTNPAGDSYGAVKNEIEGGMLDRTVTLVKKARELGVGSSTLLRAIPVIIASSTPPILTVFIGLEF